jgi:drug/metabolite transporter (DMT)-like permease
VIYGLGAALGWGVADFGAALVGRRLGSVATVVLAQVAGLATLLVLIVTVRPGWIGTPGEAAGIAVNGIVAAAAYFLLYRALEIGPVALVSPVIAAYAVITISLAVLFLGEALAEVVLLGALATVAGVILTSTDLRRLGTGARSRPTGIPYALGSMALFGVATFFLGRFSQEVGWLPALTLSRASTTTILAVIAVLARRPVPRAGIAVALGAVVVGIVDVLGGSAYARGSELGHISIVSAASATFPLIPVVGGILILRERPAATQLVGVAVVVGGLLLLGRG